MSLEEAARQRFLPAMSKQTGFVQAFLTGPCSGRRGAGNGRCPEASFQFQVTALQNPEQKRKD